MASPGQASPDALRSCLLCDPLSHSVRRKHGYEHLCLNRFDQCLSPSLDCSFVWTKTIPTVSWSPHCLIECQAQTALQRYLLNDVGVGHPTGRSELGAGGVHIGQVLPGSHKTLCKGTRRSPSAASKGRVGAWKALWSGQRIPGIACTCVSVGCVPTPLWASVSPPVRCGGETGSRWGLFQLRNPSMSEK